MKHGSLFSGIGGFDLTAEWMGWENVFHCEINKFCQKVLKYHFPNSVLYEDITKTDFSGWRGKINIVTGGFPCQPFSQAGKRKGKDDDRHLWPEMLRAIREIQPCWVVGENVPGLLNWRRGMVLAEIKADLEAAGFEVFPPVILPACGKNAPHRRDRLWIIAHNYKRNGAQIRFQTRGQINMDGIERNGVAANAGFERQKKPEQQAMGDNELSESGTIADCNHKGLQREQEIRNIEWEGPKRNEQSSRLFRTTWENFPTVSPIRGGDDGLSSKLVKQCLEALGNAIVPQVAFEIFNAIEQFEAHTGDKVNKIF